MEAIYARPFHPIHISHPDYSCAGIDSQQASVGVPDCACVGRVNANYLKVLKRQRNMLHKINQHIEIDKDLIRKYLALIDGEEFRLRENQL